MFCTDLDGECISRDSLKKLTQVITDHVSKKKVQVPFLTVSTNYNEDLELAKGVALSIHSGNGNVMVLMDGEHSAEQYHGYRNKTLRPDVDQDTLRALFTAKQAAIIAFEEFLETNFIDLKEAVREKLG